jgi:folate-binding protein YgfZ
VTDTSGVAFVRTAEQVIEVTGTDRLTHLDATTTQALKAVTPGTATAALVLDANGNPLAMFDVLVLPDRVWLVTPDAEVTAVVMDVVAGRTFLADARFALLPLEVARVVGVSVDADPTATARRAFEGATGVPAAGRVRSAPSGSTMLAADAQGALVLAGPPHELADLERRLVAAGAAVGDADALGAWRVAAGRPAWRSEVTPPHLPEELGLLPTHVHLAKGCYPGQEAVARMWMLGRPRRRLAVVTVVGADSGAQGEDADPPVSPASLESSAATTLLAPGWRTGEGRDAIEVTAVDARTGTALAFVPGTAAAGDRFGDEGAVTVEVVRLVGDEPVPPGHDPSMRRRRDRDRDGAAAPAARRP